MNNNVKRILTDDTELSDWSVEIDPVKNGKLAQEIIIALKNTMREAELISLTAPQIGYKYRIFCLKFGENDFRTFINPAVENNVDMSIVKETCSSRPDKKYIIPRFSKVKFYYTTPLGKIESATLVGKAAAVFQHCMDHLNGLLVSDVGLEIDDDFEEASTEDQEAIISMYLESLDLRQKELAEEIESDEDLSKLNDAIKFIASVKDGSTQLDNNLTSED